jgi:hypothetical protein
MLNPAYEEARNNLELTEAMAAQDQDSVQAV